MDINEICRSIIESAQDNYTIGMTIEIYLNQHNLWQITGKLGWEISIEPKETIEEGLSLLKIELERQIEEDIESIGLDEDEEDL